MVEFDEIYFRYLDFEKGDEVIIEFGLSGFSMAKPYRFKKTVGDFVIVEERQPNKEYKEVIFHDSGIVSIKHVNSNNKF